MIVRSRVWRVWRVRALAPLPVFGCLFVLGLARGDEPPRAAEKEKKEAGATIRASAETSTYVDTDHVTVVSPTVSLGMEDPIRGWSASGRYLVDVVSAASADIVSTASPRWHEIRHVGSIEGSYKPGDFGIAPRASISREPDYLSLGGGFLLSQDLDEKMWTVALGYGYGHDTIGRKSTPFDVFSRTLDRHNFSASASAVADRATRVTMIADAVLERGYLAKPYRYVPLFGGANVNVPKDATVEQINAMRSPERVAENVPDARNRYAGTLRIAHRFTGWTLRAEERLYTDSWGLSASTTDMRCMVDMGSRFTVWPHLRAHLQTGVSFWKRVYEVRVDSGNVRHIPTWITGNRELSPSKALTLGGGMSWALGPDENPNEWKLSFVADGIGTWYSDSLFLSQRYGVFSAITIDTAFELTMALALALAVPSVAAAAALGADGAADRALVDGVDVRLAGAAHPGGAHRRVREHAAVVGGDVRAPAAAQGEQGDEERGGDGAGAGCERKAVHGVFVGWLR